MFTYKSSDKTTSKEKRQAKPSSHKALSAQLGIPLQLQTLAYTQGNQVYVSSRQEKHLHGNLRYKNVRQLKTIIELQDNSNKKESSSQQEVVQMATVINYSNLYQPVAGFYGRIHWQRVPLGIAPPPGAQYMVDNIVTPQSLINVTNHVRVPMRVGEMQAALQFPVGGFVQNLCNHHVPYNRISTNIIINYLNGRTVQGAITALNLAIPALNGVGAGYVNIPPLAIRPFNLQMSQEFDDTIANIANDPRNLFYSLYHSGDGGGTLVDYPATALPAAGANLIIDPTLNAYSATLVANGI